ncbi:MAG TPA: chemotaxis-specific protein-glutamate methyltransferase CheB [Sphingomonadaceae bacterium]|nr:chemotaxis-specific protein-glutamate methyltransferase CheB [Sphingomonadaceae bacterium]
MIVDDSIVARLILARMLAGRAGFVVAASATNAREALALLDRIRVDIILLDVAMPGIDGLTALPDILSRSHGARVLILSSAAEHGAEATVRALALGAADTLLKPGAGHFAGRFAETLVERLRRIGRAARAPASRRVPCRERPACQDSAVQCIAIGASTGGVNALSALFRALPAGVTAPILVTQHLPAPFMPYFAGQLQEIAGRGAAVAADGMPLRPGEIAVAPGDGHLGLVRTGGTVRVRIERAPAASGCMPSVDPMFAAVAAIFGAAGFGVVLSGMGRDGVAGAAALVAAGGEICAQDEESSVVWGMPGAVVAAGLATASLSPRQIARRIGERAGRAPSP